MGPIRILQGLHTLQLVRLTCVLSGLAIERARRMLHGSSSIVTLILRSEHNCSVLQLQLD